MIFNFLLKKIKLNYFIYKNSLTISNIITNSGNTTVIKMFIMKCFSKRSYRRNFIKKQAKKIVRDTDTTSKIFCNSDFTI